MQRLHFIKNTRGFTLLEVMLVVLIAVLVTMAAVPAYKRNQDRNRYMAASGVLMELGTAIRIAQEEFPDANVWIAIKRSPPMILLP